MEIAGMIVRVLLADDHQLFREALRIMLEKECSIRIVAETGDGLQVLPLAQKLSPDIVCMDISMPGMNGIETTRRLRVACPASRLSPVGIFRSALHLRDAQCRRLRLRDQGSSRRALLQAIAAVLQEKKYLCPDATTAISRAQPELGDSAGQAGRLGPRERQVLQLVAEGHTSAQIAGHLQMAPSTVEVHRRNIMRKLNLHNVADLTKYAIRTGLTSG